jgi:hypothetical protein
VIVHIAGLVRVSITKESRDTGGAAAQNQLMVGSCPQIAKNVVECMLVVGPRSRSMAAKHCDSVS